MTEGKELPESVLAACERAARTGFQLACEVEVGKLLAALAAAVPGGGRILEIGTGTGVGVGLAWLVHGLGGRQDVEVVTVELDDAVPQSSITAFGVNAPTKLSVSCALAAAMSLSTTLGSDSVSGTSLPS